MKPPYARVLFNAHFSALCTQIRTICFTSNRGLRMQRARMNAGTDTNTVLRLLSSPVRPY